MQSLLLELLSKWNLRMHLKYQYDPYDSGPGVSDTIYRPPPPKEEYEAAEAYWKVAYTAEDEKTI